MVPEAVQVPEQQAVPPVVHTAPAAVQAAAVVCIVVVVVVQVDLGGSGIFLRFPAFRFLSYRP